MSGLGRGQALHLRLLIENVEVPVIGAMVSANENSPAAAQIEVIPTDTAMRLRARSKVHLFFLDYEGLYSTGNESAYKESTIRANLGKGIPDDNYKLLYTGEIFTMMYTKSGPGSRSLVLQCLDDSNTWDTAYLYMMRYADTQGESAIAGSQATFMALNTNAVQFDDILNSPEVVIRDYAARYQALSPTLQKTTGLIGGLFGILELIGGLEGKYVGITDWHTIQEARLRLLDQLAGDTGGTAAALFDNAAFQNWLQGALGQQGSVISFRQIVDLINSYIYYSVFPNPVARYIPGTRTKIDWPPGIGGTVDRGQLDPDLEATVTEILNDLQLRYGWAGTGGKGTAVFTSGYRTLEQRNAIEARLGEAISTKKPMMVHDWGYAADISLVASTEVPMSMTCGQAPAASLAEANRGLHHRLITAASIEGWTSVSQLEASEYFTDAEKATAKEYAQFFSNLGRVAQEKGLTWGGSWSKTDALWNLWGLGWDPVHLQVPGWQKEVTAGVMRADADATTLEAFYDALPERDRLITQHFRPDVWFCAPPACNVIFPEELSSFSYTRQMMRETTRLMLMTFNQLYEDMLLSSTYFAPFIEQLGQDGNLAVGGIGSADKALVYPHEKFSGVIPKMERLSDVAFYSRLSSDNKIEGTDVFPDEEEMLQDVETKLASWAARTAAFNFLTHRYAARSAVGSGRFMPRLACGWPAVVIDKPVDVDLDAEARAVGPVTPVHYLGIIKTLSHSVTQAGGSTSVTLSHARSHKSGDETDDLFAKSVYENGATLSVQVDPGQEETSQIEVNDSMSDEDFIFCGRVRDHLTAGGKLTPAPKEWENGTPALGPKGKPLTALVAEVEYALLASGEQVAEATVEGSTEGGQTANFPFKSIEVSEAQPGEAPLPLEEAIRPPWFSDEYSNDQIGDLYQELLGCGSILELVFEDGDESTSVSTAVELIAGRYSKVVQGSGAGNTFITAVTERSYASIPQVIGTSDEPGFHYYSSGDYSGLEGVFYSWMAEADVAEQIKPSEPKSVDPDLDPRAGRYKAAVDYQAALLRSHGIRG